MKKIILYLLALLIIPIAAFGGGTTVVVGQPVASEGGGECATCSTGLVQAFILDDGNADLDDWVGDNNLTRAAADAQPAWAGSNDGLVFDGTDDYAYFTPLLTEWQYNNGFSLAILTTVENTASACIFHQWYSSDWMKRLILFSSTSSAYNRATFNGGRKYDEKVLSGYPASGDSAKQWIIVTFDPSVGGGEGTGYLYKNTTLETTDSAVDTYADSYAMDEGFLGANEGTKDFAAVTIYRVMIWNKALDTDEIASIVNDNWIPTKD